MSHVRSLDGRFKGSQTISLIRDLVFSGEKQSEYLHELDVPQKINVAKLILKGDKRVESEKDFVSNAEGLLQISDGLLIMLENSRTLLISKGHYNDYVMLLPLLLSRINSILKKNNMYLRESYSSNPRVKDIMGRTIQLRRKIPGGFTTSKLEEIQADSITFLNSPFISLKEVRAMVGVTNSLFYLIQINRNFSPAVTPVILEIEDLIRKKSDIFNVKDSDVFVDPRIRRVSSPKVLEARIDTMNCQTGVNRIIYTPLQPLNYGLSSFHVGVENE